jgi:hypothetical protein
MKKLDTNVVGIWWFIIFSVSSLVVISILAWELGLFLILFLVGLGLFISIPYIITYLWNKFIAK